MKNIHGDTKITPALQARVALLLDWQDLRDWSSRPHCSTLKAYKRRERRWMQLVQRTTRGI